MSTLTEPQQRALAENVWLHFFQMGHMASTGARPTVLVRGAGSRVWDQDGAEYIDGLSGLFAVNVGYGRQEIIDAMSAQLAAIAYVSALDKATKSGVVHKNAVARAKSHTAKFVFAK